MHAHTFMHIRRTAAKVRSPTARVAVLVLVGCQRLQPGGHELAALLRDVPTHGATSRWRGDFGTRRARTSWTSRAKVSENVSRALKCPVLKQNNKLRHRTPHSVCRGHPGGRPEPTGRRLSALRGVLLPFRMDLTTNAIDFLMAHPGRWVDLALSSRDGFVRFAQRISAHL